MKYSIKVNDEKEENNKFFIKEILAKKNSKNKNTKYIEKIIYLNFLIIYLSLYFLNKKINQKFSLSNKFHKSFFSYDNYSNYLSFISKFNNSSKKESLLPKDIKFKPLMTNNELRAFLYFMKPENIYFEFGSGGSTNIASYFKLKTYSVESDINWHEKLKKNGIIANYITIDLKASSSGYPGNETNINDWKKYIQAYKKEYNANVILIDGRFRVACALDIFSKINYNTAVLIHDYEPRNPYHILEKFYIKIYSWDTLRLFQLFLLKLILILFYS